jgi:ketosteroid isomerase-like protein
MVDGDQYIGARAVTHTNETRLRQLYGRLDAGHLDTFLDGCTDDVTFLIPGEGPASGLWDKASFRALLSPIIAESRGLFLQHVLTAAANSDHAILLIFNRFVRAGQVRQYRTAHHLTLRNGLIAAWEEHPGCREEFEQAWGEPTYSSMAGA